MFSFYFDLPCLLEKRWLSLTETVFRMLVSLSPRGLTFSRWGCCGLCLRHKPTELARSLYSVLVSVSVLTALSTTFHSINSLDNSPLSHSILLVLFLSAVYLFMKVSLSPDNNSLWLTGLKALTK